MQQAAIPWQMLPKYPSSVKVVKSSIARINPKRIYVMAIKTVPTVRAVELPITGISLRRRKWAKNSEIV